MPLFERGEVAIHYEVDGDGFPVLLIAPGGLRSAATVWERAPWNPRARLSGDFQVIAMDQRNAGASRGPIGETDGWSTYTGDQVALIDHLAIDRFHVVGMCIGGSYIMGLIRALPDRVQSAVMLQPIGLDGNRDAFYALFDAWAVELGPSHPEADGGAWASFREAMFGGDFMFNTSRDDVAACSTPLLVMMGDDLYHPQSISRAIAELAPNVTFVEQWKEASQLGATDEAIKRFLAANTP